MDLRKKLGTVFSRVVDILSLHYGGVADLQCFFLRRSVYVIGDRTIGVKMLKFTYGAQVRTI